MLKNRFESLQDLDVEGAQAIVQRELGLVAAELREEGVPVPELRGKLLRPLLAYAFVPPHMRHLVDRRFWYGALAIQMVHEASLLHDDIIDGADERRGVETVNASRGVGPALVLGDHYLTAAYKVAARTEAPDFLHRFIDAVERTVAGEIHQARAAGAPMEMSEYYEIVVGKSGELIGAAACLGGAVLGLDGMDERVTIGKQIGAHYQQVDDLLDYCHLAETGKPPLQDYRQGKWTWIAGEAGLSSFGLEEDAVMEAVFARSDGWPSAAERAVAWLARARDRLVAEGFARDACPTLLHGILDSWVSAATRGVQAQRQGVRRSPVSEGAPSSEAIVAATARALGGPEAWAGYFGRHAKTFSLAARLFPSEPARRIQALYAYCRFTDDLVDDPEDGAATDELRERLAVWEALSRDAFEGGDTGIPLLEHVMGDARRASVDWLYPQALLDGVGMDLVRSRYRTWQELEGYTFGVAGAVGGWMSQLFGVRDPAVLERAHALGHAMQLTNIVRDVGEDLHRDRVYLPAELMEEHGFSVADLRVWRDGGEAVPERYRRAMEHLMGVADTYYETAAPGMLELPTFFRRPVAWAAAAYRGIHDEVRGNDYDNLNRRAHTSAWKKVVLGAKGVASARPRKTRFSIGARTGR